jgi:hypothetical protein
MYQFCSYPALDLRCSTIWIFCLLVLSLTLSGVRKIVLYFHLHWRITIPFGYWVHLFSQSATAIIFVIYNSFPKFWLNIVIHCRQSSPTWSLTPPGMLVTPGCWWRFLPIEASIRLFPYGWRDSLQLPKILAYSNLDWKYKTIFWIFFFKELNVFYNLKVKYHRPLFMLCRPT